MNLFSKIKGGPGIFVAAAFVGPGTVTTSTLAGAEYGYSLIWALLFAIFATVLLQEMCLRLGVITQRGLGANLASMLRDSVFRIPMLGLILLALLIGNIAYEGGNLAGAALGIAAISGEPSKHQLMILCLTLISGAVLWHGKLKTIQALMMFLVALMALAFVVVNLIVQPNVIELFANNLPPRIPDTGLLTVIALIGTTIVPYNLFLHSSAASSRWSSDIERANSAAREEDLQSARRDSAWSIGLGGLIAILIVSSAAASLFKSGLAVSNASDMAVQLEPLFGIHARLVMGIGLFAAGLSSAITAPLATAYVVCELLTPEHKPDTKNTRFRGIALSVLIIGASLTLLGLKPLELIMLAQVANGLLLPITAMFLLYTMNQRSLLHGHTNTKLRNIMGITVVAITLVLGIKAIAFAIS